MSARLIIDQGLFDTRCFLVRDGTLVDVLWTQHDSPDPTGAIHHGRVREINRSMGAAFVELEGQETGLLRLRKGVRVTEGQKLFVQITDAPSEPGKLSHVTTKPVLVGRFTVVRPLQEEAADKGGVTTRTAAKNADHDAIEAETAALKAKWARLSKDLPKQPVCVYRDTPIDQALRDMTPPDLSVIEVTSPDGFNTVRKTVTAAYPDLQPMLRAPHEIAFIGLDDATQDQILTLTSPIVDLPDGGTLTIERTRAMTVVDVDSGAGQNASEANWHAACALKQHLALRRIGGMSVVDFITLPREDARRFGDRLRTLFKDDPQVERIGGPSPNGLVEIIRKRRGRSLVETLEISLDPEEGSLSRLRTATVAAEISRLLPSVAKNAPHGAIHVTCAPIVARFFQDYKADDVLAMQTGRALKFVCDETLRQDQFSIDLE